MAEDGDGQGISDRHKENYEARPSMIHEISNSSFASSVSRTNTTRDSYWFAHGGVGECPSTTNHSIGSGEHTVTDGKEYSPQKEREEKIRIFKEQQEEERLKRLQELEQSFMVSKKYREQQEEERRRKIEEARIKEIDRRQQVEERKRQIWEAEQERKEAILRRNLEREARIEARRNAQRNSLCFAFGSSTPRTFDLDLAALGGGGGSAQLMSAVSGRRSEDRDFIGKRATSACSLDRRFELDYLYDDYSDASRDNSRTSSVEPPTSRINISKQLALKYMKSDETRACLTMSDNSSSHSTGSFNYLGNIAPCWLTGSGAIVEGDDVMSRSMVSLSSVSRGRRKTDLMPTVFRERSTTPVNMSRGKQSLRAVSMTRLDQLAQPRRRYFEPLQDNTMVSSSPTKGFAAVSPSVCKSMCNLFKPSQSAYSVRKVPCTSSRNASNLSRSMLHLPEPSPRKSHVALPDFSPSYPKAPSPTQHGMRSAQSMTHLAITPRLTRATRLRADAVACARKDGFTSSILSISKTEKIATGNVLLSVSKDGCHSPSRPRSSMSGTSEFSTTSSQASGVIMRPKPTPRRPRPVTIAGTTPDRSSAVCPMTSSISRAQLSASKMLPSIPKTSLSAPKDPSPTPKIPERQGRPNDRKVPMSSVAKSVGNEQSFVEKKSVIENKKPLPPPKTSEILAKAKSHPLSAKGNLRKPEIAAEEPMKPLSPEPLVVESSVPCDKETYSEDQTKKERGDQDLRIVVVAQDEAHPQNVEERDVSPFEEICSKPRITSEEEAKAALAEKRRLAREQAEQEAELERQHQEELKRQEEEKKRIEELEQKRLEEEQLRLAELHRRMEEEKLQRAIEEQQQKEKEEQEKREEEARLKAEKDEQDKKAREEAERQRIELEQRLRKEEEERAERKRRVEQIMSRTRGKGTQPNSCSLPNSQTGSKSATPVEDNKLFISTNKALAKNSLLNDLQSIHSNPNSCDSDLLNDASLIDSSKFSSGIEISSNSYALDPNFTGQLQNLTLQSSMSNGHYQENTEISHMKTNGTHNWSHVTNGTFEEISLAVQTNGYSSHEEMSCTTSPEDKSEASNSSGIGIVDVGSNHELSSEIQGDQSEFEQLIDLGEVEQCVNQENFLVNADNVNSNVAPPGNPFIAFEENISKKQEASIADLLS